MSRIHHIVVGIEAGRLADPAAVHAVHLARSLQVSLEIVHAINTPAERPWFADEPTLARLHAECVTAVRQERISHLESLLCALASTPQEIEAMLHVETGRPSSVLRARAEARAGTLLIVGGHRRRGLLDLGGTARELIGHPPGPLWIHGASELVECRRILVAVDLSAASDSVWAMARELANALAASVTLLHCYESPIFAYHNPSEGIAVDPAEGGIVTALRDREQQEFEGFARSARTDCASLETCFVEGDPARVMLDAQAGHDLIVMGTRGHSALGRVLMGSHAYQVLNEAECPVLVVPRPELVADR